MDSPVSAATYIVLVETEAPFEPSPPETVEPFETEKPRTSTRALPTSAEASGSEMMMMPASSTAGAVVLMPLLL